jgi:hypothetical protein
MRRFLALLAIWPTIAASQQTGRCSFHIDSLPLAWETLRSLAGAYDIEWRPDPLSEKRFRGERLWLWHTSPFDSSLGKPTIRPPPDDTIHHVLWGVIGSGATPLTAEDSLRRASDPIAPPVLLLGPYRPGEPGTLLVGTIETRRPNVISLDGAGVGIWLSRADSNGFAGRYRPWGLLLTDSGYFCAKRIR